MAPAAIGVYAGILAALWHGGKIARAVRFASRGIYTELAGADFDVKREVEVVQGRNSASDARWLPSRVNRQVIPHLAYSAAWCHVNRQVIPRLALLRSVVSTSGSREARAHVLESLGPFGRRARRGNATGAMVTW